MLKSVKRNGQKIFDGYIKRVRKGIEKKVRVTWDIVGEKKKNSIAFKSSTACARDARA